MKIGCLGDRQLWCHAILFLVGEILSTDRDVETMMEPGWAVDEQFPRAWLWGILHVLTSGLWGKFFWRAMLKETIRPSKFLPAFFILGVPNAVTPRVCWRQPKLEWRVSRIMLYDLPISIVLYPGRATDRPWLP